MIRFGKYFCSAALLMMLAACSVNDDSSGDDPVPPERYETVLNYFKEINAVPRPSRHEDLVSITIHPRVSIDCHPGVSQ